MALGFGFNKAKVLSSAEKFVQQGKIQQAINEYEKVCKHDPKDLALLNTLGDLYARVGQPDRAASYFKSVGEAYAADGFTVKAIAIYKKVTKITPGETGSIQRLAELYSQQNLLTDARHQYLLVAEHHIKSGNLEAAVRIFHKMLELDPDSAPMQTKLAELYLRMGKKDQAKEIFFRSAQCLHLRRAFDAADEALGRVLNITPGDQRALMLRAQIALETGNPANTVHYLESIPNIDSSLEGLALLLQARINLNQPEEADPLARKMLVVHNEIAGINTFAEWLLSHGEFERALQLYSEHSDQLLANNPEMLLNALRDLTERVRDNASALEILLVLLQKAGDQSRLTEVIELLAHALVQKGDLQRARDCYRNLAVLEPENPVHDQNYRQVIARLGEDSALRTLSPQEGGQAFMVDELECSAPSVDQEHVQAVADAINAAVTESELLDSYGMLPKATALLESALSFAPEDIRLNQRLASLYARTSRYRDAAACCEILASVYKKAGHDSQYAEYRDLAIRYRDRADAEHEVQIEVQIEPQHEELPAASLEAGSYLESVPGPNQYEFSAPPALDSISNSTEIDISEEWAPVPDVEQASPVPEPAAVAPLAPEAAPAQEMLEEIRFYISQQMWEEAAAVAERCTALGYNLPELAELSQQIESVHVFEIPESHESAPASPVHASAEFEVEVAQHTAAPEAIPFVPPMAMPPSVPSIPAAAAASPNALGTMVAEIEESLGEDFVPAPAPQMQAALPVVMQPPVVPFEFPAALSVPEMAPAAVPMTESVHETIAPAGSIAMPGDVLFDMFEEFKESAEETNIDGEDPENHYNLGVAFREMGLMDEAIGELQKVAQGIERGVPFKDTLQVYTLLGQCFLEKGIPEAAVPWYEKALGFTSDPQAQTAIHYELGSVHESAGSRQTALHHFLRVYGTNIDYRDVSERIKALRP
ncbi:MAG TPA: tetratricopeptide repeat protein [Terriglobales bacterium]|nr:tetratricopeptide repeat protein [Terriglobales bacterium]